MRSGDYREEEEGKKRGRERDGGRHAGEGKGRKKMEGDERNLRPQIDHLYHHYNVVSHTITVRFGEDGCSDFVSSSVSLRLATNMTQAMKYLTLVRWLC